MKRLIVDMSSLLWQSLLVGKDEEHGTEVEHDGKMVRVNGWQFGQECLMNHLLYVMESLAVSPIDLIFVVEGAYAKQRRKSIYREYKEGRGSRPQLAYDHFDTLKNKVTNTFLNLGSQVVTQDGVEADDIIAYLVNKLKGDKVILTSDGDLATLIKPDTPGSVGLWRGGSLTYDNPYGPFLPRFIPVYKALVGDGQEYKGASGFGPKAFMNFMIWQGERGLAALEGMILRHEIHDLIDDSVEFKPLQKIIDSAAHVYESYECALLHDEWVDTLRQPLVWKAGMVKPASVIEDRRLHRWAQRVKLVTASNYKIALQQLTILMKESPFVSLDIETSTPEESDQWLIAGSKENKVDVLGSKLTGLGLTLGVNNNYSYYFSIDHKDTDNISSADMLEVIKLIPKDKFIAIQNFAFEGPILYKEWGEKLKDNGWYGFLPNVVDTVFLASYVDENISLGLKQGSLHYLGYEQESYQSVTTFYAEDGTPTQYKMNQLTAQHVLSYGTDDTICTAALFNHFRIRMEIENTWDLQLQVEQLPAYVMALSYVKGVRFSLQRMLELQEEDRRESEKARQNLDEFLLKKKWAGSTPPVFTVLDNASVKSLCKIVLDTDLETRVRTPNKLARLIEEIDHEDAKLVACLVEYGDLSGVNNLVRSRFSAKPTLNTGSVVQMRKLLYDVLELPVRLVNPVTAKERESNKLLAYVIMNHKREWAGYDTDPIPDYLFSKAPHCDRKELINILLISKAKTDEHAIDFALSLDVQEKDNPIAFTALTNLKTIKKCATRESLFYKPYRYMPHWLDHRIHGQAGQCRTVTRRFAPSDPNLAQLPKKGDGAKFRECFVPHKEGAVIVSVDFSGQELRQGAGQSMDQGMLDCFVGRNKKDMHSMTASGAMRMKWGNAVVNSLVSEYPTDTGSEYDLFMEVRRKGTPAQRKMADDLRKVAKNVNFGAQYDAQAPKLAETLIIPVPDAQTFLDAKYEAFPRFEQWKEEVKNIAEIKGYVTTPLGGRRHLRDSILSREYGVKDKALRQGPNFKIQGASAEQTKLAMSELWKSGILFKLDMEFFAPVHDELVWSVAAKDALESIHVVVKAMTKPYGNLPVPFLGSVSLGLNFGKQIECGDAAAEKPELLNKIVPKILDQLFDSTDTIE